MRRELGGRAERIDHCVVLAGDDVRRRDDDSWSGDPARALDAEPACRAEDPDDARRRRTDAGYAQDLRVRRRNLRERPAERRERVKPCKRLKQGRRW